MGIVSDAKMIQSAYKSLDRILANKEDELTEIGLFEELEYIFSLLNDVLE